MADAVALLLLDLAIIIFVARLLGILATKIGQPKVIGEILGGVLLGPTLFGHALTDVMFPEQIRLALDTLAMMGLVLFMFLLGYEVDKHTLRNSGRTAVSVAVFSVALPLGLGALLALWLAQRHDVLKV